MDIYVVFSSGTFSYLKSSQLFPSSDQQLFILSDQGFTFQTWLMRPKLLGMSWKRDLVATCESVSGENTWECEWEVTMPFEGWRRWPGCPCGCIFRNIWFSFCKIHCKETYGFLLAHYVPFHVWSGRNRSVKRLKKTWWRKSITPSDQCEPFPANQVIWAAEPWARHLPWPKGKSPFKSALAF